MRNRSFFHCAKKLVVLQLSDERSLMGLSLIARVSNRHPMPDKKLLWYNLYINASYRIQLIIQKMIIWHFLFFVFQLHPNVTQGNGHAVLTSSTTQTAFQVIIVVIRQLIVMTSQMNKIAVSTNSTNFLWYSWEQIKISVI